MPHLKQTLEKGLPFGVGFVVLAIAAVLFWYNPSAIQKTRNQVFDTFQKIAPRPYIPVPVRILDIDEESIRRYGQWPWDRQKIAAIIEQVQDMGVAALAFDVLFAEPDRTSPQRLMQNYETGPAIAAWLKTLPDNDAMMADALKRGRVVTAFVLTGTDGGSVAPRRAASFLERGDSPVPFVRSFPGATKSLGPFEESAAGNGSINFLPHLDGVIRTVPLLFSFDGNLYPALSIEALRVAQGQKRYAVSTTSAQGEQSLIGRAPGLVSVQVGALSAPVTKDGQLNAYYTEPVPERTIPIWKILEDPDIVMPILNDYPDKAIGVTFDYDGTLDKVVGDALHIMFSAPVSQADHAQRAVDCALALDDFAEAFRAEKNANGFPLGRTRIGINTGEVLVGNFGGDRLFDYTAHGDAINVAARLEAANKKTGTRICVSEDTIRGCTRFDGRPIGNLMLKGKTKATMVYEPLRPKDAAFSYRHHYADAFALLDTDAGMAQQQFKTLHEEYPQDTLVAMHLKRLENGESGSVVTV